MIYNIFMNKYINVCREKQDMRWKRKLLLAVLAAAASAVGGTEIAKKRFGEGKGEAYRRFLDKVIRYREEDSQVSD